MDVARVTRLVTDDGPFARSLAAIVLTAAWIATWRPQVDPDAWWHIALGDLIVRDQAITSTEPFSWLTSGDRVVVHSWLWDVLIAEAHRSAGAVGTSLLIVPVTAVIVGVLWTLLRVADPAMSPVARAALVLAAVVAAVPSWAPRAQTLDVAFVLATVLVLDRYLRDGRLRTLTLLPIIGVLWANLHGSAVLALVGLIVVALVALPIGARLGRWSGRAPGPLLVGGAAAVAATAINPYGPGLLGYPFDRGVASAFIPEIVEWRPPDLGAIHFLPFTVLIIVAVAWSIARRARSPDVFLLASAAGWTVAALWSARFVAIAACLLVVAIGAASGATQAPSGSGARGRRVGPAGSGSAAVLVLTTAFAIAALVAVGWTLVAPSAQDAAIRHRLPVEAVEALASAHCSGRLLVDYGWGGYVIWAMDRDVGAYGNSAEGAVREQVAVERVHVDVGSWLDGHDVDLVLMPSDGPLSGWLDLTAGWTAVYRDLQASIHGRAHLAGCL